MEIKRGSVVLNNQNFICTYGESLDGKRYYFVAGGELVNGNRIVTLDVREALNQTGGVIKTLGLIDNDGKELIPLENKSVNTIDGKYIIFEKTTPNSNEVIDVSTIKADPLEAAKFAESTMEIKERMRVIAGESALDVYANPEGAASVFTFDGISLTSGKYYNYITKGKNGFAFATTNPEDEIGTYSNSQTENETSSNSVPEIPNVVEEMMGQMADTSSNSVEEAVTEPVQVDEPTVEVSVAEEKPLMPEINMEEPVMPQIEEPIQTEEQKIEEPKIEEPVAEEALVPEIPAMEEPALPELSKMEELVQVEEPKIEEPEIEEPEYEEDEKEQPVKKPFRQSRLKQLEDEFDWDIPEEKEPRGRSEERMPTMTSTPKGRKDHILDEAAQVIHDLLVELSIKKRKIEEQFSIIEKQTKKEESLNKTIEEQSDRIYSLEEAKKELEKENTQINASIINLKGVVKEAVEVLDTTDEYDDEMEYIKRK